MNWHGQATIRVEAAWEWDRWRGRREFGGGLWLYLPGRMLRIWANWGTAPGSHMISQHATAWRTRMPTDGLDGWNARFGWWPAPCLTLLAHTRRLERKN